MVGEESKRGGMLDEMVRQVVLYCVLVVWSRQVKELFCGS